MGETVGADRIVWGGSRRDLREGRGRDLNSGREGGAGLLGISSEPGSGGEVSQEEGRWNGLRSRTRTRSSSGG